MKPALATAVAVLYVATAAPAVSLADARHPVVVIDPGHGGSNLGAPGVVDGLREKYLTLAIAERVAGLLRGHDIVVQLTRTTDRTMTLRQRTEVAERADADLFVSIHANASPARTQRGFETFLLTTKGIDVDGRALRADVGAVRPGVAPDVARVLDDVERGAAQLQAAELAARIQRELRDRRGAPNDRGVRQDIDHVLLGATMPAVLVEVGFIDHPIEGKELADPAIQAAIAAGIAQAIEDQLAD